MYITSMTADQRGDLTEMVDLLYRLGVIKEFEHYSNAINHVIDLFDKYGRYDSESQ